MPVKKLSIKKGKKGKLAIHKEAPEPVEEVGEDESEVEDPPFEPDEIEPGEQVEVATKPKKTFGKMAAAGKAGKPIQGLVGVKEQDKDENLQHVYIDGAESVEPANKPMANVGYGMDRTVNLGDFESLKIHVTLHVPSDVDEAEIEANYEFCKGWVETKMEEVISEYTDSDD